MPLGLPDLTIGLVFRAGPDARATLHHVQSTFHLHAGQLAIPGDYPLRCASDAWDAALRHGRFTLTTLIATFTGEDYADIPTVERTVGLIPASTRTERTARTKAIANLGKDLGIDSIACHIGFLPEDPQSPLYSQIRDTARDLCDHCAKNGQNFTLETGQEPAHVLLQFMTDVARPNLKINFDPANMILYGTGDPLEALTALAPHVVSVHCKDGDWPPRDLPEALGTERPLGEGSVNIPAFIHKLKEIGYRGVLAIEREEPNPAVREADIQKAITLLKKVPAPQ
jgi:sugar phosphate isomerase/epimerase